ncbi:MAG: hypothetical protein AVDCRST_MAG61-2293, partial [uncultured Friedmanniella sp.]
DYHRRPACSRLDARRGPAELSARRWSADADLGRRRRLDPRREKRAEVPDGDQLGLPPRRRGFPALGASPGRASADHLRRGGADAVGRRRPLGQALLRVLTPGRADGGQCGHRRLLRRQQRPRRSRERGAPEGRPAGSGVGLPLLDRRPPLALRPGVPAWHAGSDPGRLSGSGAHRAVLHRALRPGQLYRGDAGGPPRRPL